MALYVWDLAFNFNHRPKPDGTYDLQIGLLKEVEIDDGKAKKKVYIPASPVAMAIGDEVGFSIYDLTKTGTWTKTVLHCVVIEFSAATLGGRSTPFGDMEIVLAPTFKHQGASKSAYFGGQYPVHTCADRWLINAAADGHHCEMTVTAFVTKVDGSGNVHTRRFVVDPEMIVDSNG